MTFRVFTFGESMGLVLGDEINSLDQLAKARISTGGSEGNVAVGLARLGVAATWLSRVGNDGFGKRVVKDLQAEGVRVVAQIDSSAPTGLMIKTTPRAGSTSVDYYRRGSAASLISVSDLDGIDFNKFDLVHLTGITPALSDSARSTWEHVALKSREAGCLVSLDVNYRSKLWTPLEASSVMTKALDLVDILIAGVDEAQMILGDLTSSAFDLARKIQALGPQIVAIKLGSEGAVLLERNTTYSADAIRVEVVDTVGAGDAFTAAFIATYLETHDARLALDRANIAGGLACTHPGDWQGFPSAEEISNYQYNDPVQR